MPSSPEPPPTVERPPAPAWVRYVVCPTYRPQRAALLRLSCTAAGLLAPEPVAEGTAVLLELAYPVGDDPSEGRLARVASVEPVGQGDHLVQCRFDPPLSEADLAAVRQRLTLSETDDPG